jgi:hypothetical protein
MSVKTVTSGEGGIAEIAGVDAVAPGDMRELLHDALAVRMTGAVAAETAARWASGVRAARAEWVSDFGSQFSVGRAWYTHLEQDRADEYFANVAASDASVERACPGLQAAMRDLAALVVGAPVAQRAGWCGPGVHVFPAGGEVATRGGEIHFDTEGLTPAHRAERAPALTLVLMLQPPSVGGGLRVWDSTYEPAEDAEVYEVADGADDDEDDDESSERMHVACKYAAGTLVVIDSYRLHQIQWFGGTDDRISATIHAAYTGGAWETWF